jgi:histidine triad (HIT) family protein
MDRDCIFCKIATGQIPCHKLYEDQRVLAFLDLGPLSHGHTLVIPKHHAVTLGDLPDEDAAAVGAVLPRLGRAVCRATGTQSYNVLQNNGEPAGQVVMHVHFHIIPKPPAPPAPPVPPDTPRTDTGPGSGLGIGWPAGKLGSDDAKKLIEKILAALG